MNWFILILTLAMPETVFNFANTSIPNNILLKIEDELTNEITSCPKTVMKPVASLLDHIVRRYFTNCVTLILYDEFFYKSHTFQPVILQLINSFSQPVIHGQFSSDVTSDKNNIHSLLINQATHCADYIILSQTLEIVAEMLGRQTLSKVVLVPQVSQWALRNFLESTTGNQLVNLLIVADPSLQLDTFTVDENIKEDINLYTHELYADPLGLTVPRLLTSWRCNKLTRPDIDLFPPKMATLNGYQLRVVATEQPPYVYQSSKQDQLGEAIAEWDGLEIRLLNFISKELNITLKFHQPSTPSWENTAESVLHDLSQRKADVAIAGVYVTAERLRHFHSSSVHSHDCAVFMTLASTALPKYRAIMGPFKWEVWLSITLAYIFAIVPLTYSAFHTLRHLIDNPWEIENMFWYVFGTFTNCFTFSGKKSWSSAKMNSTRMFIGAYWAFSIIVSAAYTGSIISFIMLPSFPEVIESTAQLVDHDFRIATTNKSQLENAFYNSSESNILELSHTLKIVESVEEGISNVTDSPFFRKYAFLHSREFLKHIIQTKYTQKKSSKKKAFHLSKDCFVPMLVAMMFPTESILVDRIDTLLMRANQGGFLKKLVTDVAWDQQRTGSGKLLEVSGGGGLPPSERQLTLDDTQGMFMLLGIGFALAVISLIAELLVPVWRNRAAQFSARVIPSVSVTSASEHSSRNFQFQRRDDFLRYFGDPTHFLAEAEVHVPTQAAAPPPNRDVQSLTALQQEATLCDKRLSV